MKLNAITSKVVLLALVSISLQAKAVCLDPKTLVSGYKLPLGLEVRTSDAIVVGRVLSERGLKEDPTDPDGYTAHDLTIKVLTRLKGNLPGTIVIRNDNTSARYPMSIGEEHILFVTRVGGALSVNSCGNSSVMPRGRRVVKQVQRELQKVAMGAN